MNRKQTMLIIFVVILVFVLPQMALATSLPMTINFMPQNRQVFKSNPIPENAMVDTLKLEVKNKTGAEPAQQVLVHYGEILQDGHPLYEYGLYDGATLDLYYLWDFVIDKGSGGFWIRGASGGLTFVGSGDFSLFQKVMVDGNALNSGDYTAGAGSTVITLLPSFLQTLSLGTHTIAIDWYYGVGTGTFSVLLTAPAPPSPETGDTSRLPLWITLAAVSLLLLAGGGRVALRRR